MRGEGVPQRVGASMVLQPSLSARLFNYRLKCVSGLALTGLPIFKKIFCRSELAEIVVDSERQPDGQHDTWSLDILPLRTRMICRVKSGPAISRIIILAKRIHRAESVCSSS